MAETFPQLRASQFIQIEKFDIQVYLIRVELWKVVLNVTQMPAFLKA